MARSIWKGNITFGLVNIPVVLFSAERRSEIHFNLLDKRNKARVRFHRVNEATGEEVPWENIVKAFEYEKGSYVLFQDDELKQVAVEASQTVEIEDFVDKDEIGQVYFDKPYYLVPGKKGEKGYVLLRETLKRSNKVGIAKVVIRTKQYLSVLIPQENALMLDLIRFKDEIRALDEFDFPEGSLEDYKISDKELDMAEKLVANLTTEWQPEKYKDDFQEALLDWVDKKIAAGKTEEPLTAEAQPERKEGQVIDLMSLLKESVEKSTKGKPQEETQKKKPASKKRAAGK